MIANGTRREVVRVNAELWGRTLPHDPVAEANVLGAMVRSNGRAIPDVERVLRAGDFYAELNQRLYGSILRAYDRHKGVVDLGLLTSLDADDKTALRKYAEGTPGIATIPHFARIVADKAFLRRVVEQTGSLAHAAMNADDIDIEDIRAKAAETFSGLAEREGGEGCITLADAAAGLYNRLESGGEQVYRVGLSKFDADVGLPKQGLVVVTGANGSGKSTLALQMLRAVSIREKVPTWVFSFEMPATRLAATWASQETGRNYHAMLRGYTNASDFEALAATMESWAGATVRIDPGNPSAQEIYNTLARSREDGFRVALVDYVQNLPASPGSRAQSQTDRVQESMRILQRAARELDMLVICVSQMVLSASREHRRPPTMWDIRDSGAVADVADLLMAVWRPGHGVAEADQTVPPDEGLLCVLKAKYGEAANYRVRFLAGWMLFREDETALA